MKTVLCATLICFAAGVQARAADDNNGKCAGLPTDTQIRKLLQDAAAYPMRAVYSAASECGAP